jgi:hypothetical protein
VVSLVAVLISPALGALLDRPQAPLRLHAVWSSFVLILLAVGLFNTLPTRYWLTGAACFAGQWLLLATTGAMPAFVRGIAWMDNSQQAALAAMCLGASDVFRTWLPLPRRVKPVDPLDQMWLDFRDSFGTAWALRVAERFNTAAAMYGWTQRLAWRGLTKTEAARDAAGRETESHTPSAEASRAMRKVLHGLLRRFVSPQWMEEAASRSPCRPQSRDTKSSG